MRYLILIDSKFPYNYGESFLENEIGEIHSYFDKILIFPCIALIGEEPTRKVELDNVEVVPYEEKKLEERKKAYQIRAFTRLFRYKGNFNRRLYTAYFDIMSISQAQKVFKKLENYPISRSDEVYIYSYWLYNTAKMAVYLKDKFLNKGIRAFTFSRAHRFDIYEEKDKRGFLPFRDYLLNGLDRVFPCSDNGTEYIERKYPSYADKIQTSYLGTYDHGLGVEEKKDDFFEVISCSRVTTVKCVHKIVEALQLLEQTGLKIRWTHIGDGELLQQVKKMCQQKLNKTEVDFLGSIPNTEVYRYYSEHHADLFVNVSSSEGLPVSIMEAISFGIPVIATDVGGTNEIVREGITGYILTPDCPPEELANKIKRIAELPESQYQQLRKATREYWDTHFDAKKNYHTFANTLLMCKESET